MSKNEHNFYEKLLVYKAKTRMNNEDLGKIVGKTGSAFRMAVNRKSLTDLEKKEIEKMFESEILEDKSEPNVVMTNIFKDYEKKNNKVDSLIEEMINKALKPLENQIEDVKKQIRNIYGDIAILSDAKYDVDASKLSDQSKKAMNG